MIKINKKMNNKIIIGLILFIIGIVSQLTIENELIDFFSAILIGVGIGLLVGNWKNKMKK
tara:strand:+ start:356 stop:535 length:180 start_codon:yes stop_codon:yes gene_type:complete